MTTRWGAVAGSVEAPGPVQLLMSTESTDQPTRRRRIGSRRFELTLPAGRHRLTIEDERSLHDPARYAGTTVEVDVEPGRTLAQTFTLVPGAVIRATAVVDARPARFARVSARHADGERFDVRSDGTGGVVLAGLRAGTWTLVAEETRGHRLSEQLTVELAAGQQVDAHLALTLDAARLLVNLRSAGPRAVDATTVTVEDLATGRRVVAPVRDGAADVRGLRPGAHRLHVAAGPGHLATELRIDHLEGLCVADVVVPVGATVRGRVVQGTTHLAPQYAAVITLLDAEGRELERTRCDERGRFELGVGLATTAGLTVVATSGPETLHVTRVARSEVDVVAGVRHDLGHLALPVAGRAAVWRPGTPAIAGMKLPSTRV